MSYLDVGGHLQKVDGATNYRRTLGRVKSLLGEDSMPAALAKQAAPSQIQWGAATLAGAVAGGILGYKHEHWMLGAIAGGSLFTNTPHLFKGETRSEAFWNMAQVAGGTLLSLKMESNRALGFAIGWAAMGVARALTTGGV